MPSGRGALGGRVVTSAGSSRSVAYAVQSAERLTRGGYGRAGTLGNVIGVDERSEQSTSVSCISVGRPDVDEAAHLGTI